MKDWSGFSQSEGSILVPNLVFNYVFHLVFNYGLASSQNKQWSVLHDHPTVVYLAQLLGAALYIHLISYHDSGQLFLVLIDCSSHAKIEIFTKTFNLGVPERIHQTKPLLFYSVTETKKIRSV